MLKIFNAHQWGDLQANAIYTYNRPLYYYTTDIIDSILII